MKILLCMLLTLCLESAVVSISQASSFHSGIRGKIVASNTAPIPPEDMNPDTLKEGDPMPDITVIIYRFYGHKKKLYARLKTNSRGQFGLRCPPGQYSVKSKPREENNGYSDAEVKVKVLSHKFAYVQTDFDCGF